MLIVPIVQVRPGTRPAFLGQPFQPGAEPTGGGSGNYRPGGDAGDVDKLTEYFRPPGHPGKQQHHLVADIGTIALDKI